MNGGEVEHAREVAARTPGSSAETGPAASSGRSAHTHRVLWVAQAVLALVFLFAGGAKLMMPAKMLTAQLPLPALFLRCVGAAELLGAIGLILPALLGIRPHLTRLAARGLVVVMIGATVVTLRYVGAAPALFPLATGALCALVAFGPWRAAPVYGRTEPRRAG